MGKTRAANLLRPKRWFSFNKKGGKGVLFWSVAFLFVSALFVLGISGYVLAGEPGTFAYGVNVGGLELGGRTRAEASRLIDQRLAGLSLTYRLDDAKLDVTAASKQDGQPVFTVDSAKALDEAMKVGHGSGQLGSIVERLVVVIGGREVPLSAELNGQRLTAYLEERLAAGLESARDAAIRVTVDEATGAAEASIEPERDGLRVDYQAAVTATQARLAALQGGVVMLTSARDTARVSAADLKPMLSEAAAVVGNAPLRLTVNGLSWTVSRALAAGWVTSAFDEQTSQPRLTVDAKKITKFLAAKNDSVYVAPKDASFEEKDGRVTKIVASVDGMELDAEAGVAAVEKVLFRTEGDGTVVLPTKPVRPEKPTELINPYGVKEIIGIGESNFRGSTTNRKHNIRTGAAALNGIVIPAGETFSTIKSLGAIDGEHGYKQELVIKGNKTKPEYGGGLCQVGSTVFRAALNSALPVVERQNHSYRVPYYERDGAGKTIGPGKDATIYDPSPDLKFVNDTGHPVIVMNEIEGLTLRFIFWGVKDGRSQVQSPVRVYNETAPPPKQLIETDDLPPGKVKCTETPHAGADAVFTYTITYADGKEKKKDFRSHYKPWGEVCLVGRDPNAPKAEAAVVEATPATADAAGASGN
jgi:vancomycin resistance protein YoaR